MASGPKPSLQLSAHEYGDMMRAGHLTSEDLALSFLDQIARHNNDGLKLRAIISVCPRDVAIAQARTLDEERRRGELRSELHGIPIVVKDAIVTDPALGMVTSAGSAGIATLKATRNATVVERLLDAGLIILGKGNLTEFCGLKAEDTPIGWSAYGGQTLSPYRRRDLKDEDQASGGGSSVGPAVSIAAGFAPLGIGTETGGSNIYPASLNGLYGLTLPHGSVPVDGIQRLSETFDRVGLMARDPHDLVALAKVLLKSDNIEEPHTWEHGMKEDAWKGLSVGILDSEWGTHSSLKWKWASAEVTQKYAFVAEKMRRLGARVAFPLQDPPQPEILQYEGDTALVHKISYHEFSRVFGDFLATNFEQDPELTNLSDLIAWNQAHAEAAMPEPYTKQTELVKCLNDTMTPERHDAAVVAIRRIALEEGMAKYMREQHLDIILSPSDSSLISFSSCAGWSVATMPVSNLTKNDQPWGFFALARDGRMDLLARLMGGFHGSFERIRGPPRPFE